jgi:hypothetical protein
MALTDFCDILGAVHEDGFNRLIFHVMSQRPSLFHYGTESFVKNPSLLCCPPEFIHPEVNKRGNPVVGVLDPLPIPGYVGNFGLEYNFSLTNLVIDLEPSGLFILPPELNPPLSKQSFAIQAIVCGGIACPDQELLKQFIIYPEPYRPDFNKLSVEGGNYNGTDPNRDKAPLRGLPFRKVNCFKLELYAILNFARENYAGEPVLSMQLQNLEIVDIQPEGLENSLECYIRTTLILGIFPKLRIALNALTFNIKDFILVGPTPVSPQVPFNPSVDNDTLTVRLSLSNP